MKRTLATAALALSLTVSGWAWAQEQFSDEKLQSFVVAAIAVDELIQEWNPRIEAAADDAEAAELREQANAELMTTITESGGITVEEYQEIGRAAQGDPDLASRIRTIYEESQSGG